jgi:hypothetical protein
VNGWPLIAEGIVWGVLVGWVFWRLPGLLRSALRLARRALRRLHLRRVGLL